MAAQAEVGEVNSAYYAAPARASKAAGDDEAANRYLERAAAVPIEEADDRELLERDLATI